ncbi:hypothetical protein [Sulfurimonas sp. NW9]
MQHKLHIVIVDDETVNLLLLESIVNAEGYEHIRLLKMLTKH